MLHKGNILPPVKKMVSFQRGGLLICLLQRSLHPKRQIPDIQLSPVLPAQCRLWWIFSSSIACPLWKVGYQSHLLGQNMGERGEQARGWISQQEQRTRVCEETCQSQRRAGGCRGPITRSNVSPVSLRGDRPSAPYAGDCVRHAR